MINYFISFCLTSLMSELNYSVLIRAVISLYRIHYVCPAAVRWSGYDSLDCFGSRSLSFYF
jgi:hypothetical protein